MPFPVQELIVGHQKAVTVRREESIQTALDRMTEHDFTQLPVVDDDDKPLGMVTSDSLLRALRTFDVTPSALGIVDATVRARLFRPDDDLFDVLDDLSNSYAVLIVDGQEHLIGIVTSYDTTEYFRRRSEDIMLVRDIETLLKDYILAAFTDGAGETDQVALSEAIERITPSEGKSMNAFEQALRRYMELQGDTQQHLDKKHAEIAFTSCLAKHPTAKPFDRLTLNEYIELFLHKSQWHHYSSTFTIRPDAIRRLLTAIRQTRNDLAHFRDEISPTQRHELRFCMDWLVRHQPKVAAAAVLDVPEIMPSMGDVAAEAVDVSGPASQVDEQIGSNESRYAPLALFLQNQPIRQDTLVLTFQNVEDIIGDTLPPYARRHRSWWANDSVGHVQSQQWLDVGWRVSTINMNEQRVQFSRIKDRERLYIHFFSALLTELRMHDPYQLKPVSPDGQHWIAIAGLPEPRQAVLFLFVFNRKRKFGVQLYIDTIEQRKNKQIFDQLFSHKETIEAMLGEELSWEQLDDRRASRIALYHDGAITDSEDSLAQLRKWAVNAMVRFQDVMHKSVDDIMSERV